MLNGLYAGFNVWWVPYLYIWTILWAITMLIPRQLPKKLKYVVYPAVCCLHGIAFGTLYAPAHAIMFRMNFETAIAWIISGLPWDLIHGFGNLLAGMLIVPLSELMIRLLKRPHISLMSLLDATPVTTDILRGPLYFSKYSSIYFSSMPLFLIALHL